jgi:hypothetical protein
MIRVNIQKLGVIREADFEVGDLTFICKNIFKKSCRPVLPK